MQAGGVRLRIRAPLAHAGKLSKVTVGGQPWTKFSPAEETIDIAASMITPALIRSMGDIVAVFGSDEAVPLRAARVDLSRRVVPVPPRLPVASRTRLYEPSSEDGSYNYDNCGLLDPDTGMGYLPKERFANYTEFINAIKPPFFANVEWEIIDSTVDGAPACFNSATRRSLFVTVAVLLASVLVM